ncbi:hypothetical protein HYY75_07010 [bacterium]|nr:hypothetical protein [bacterium]
MEITKKSRVDIIDTTLQKQFELRVFRYLLLLFFLAVIYEQGFPEFFKNEPVFPFSPKYNSPVISPFPAKSIKKLILSLSRLRTEFPMLAVQMKRFENEVRKTALEKVDSDKSSSNNRELVVTLQSMWEFFHLPTWEDPKSFNEVNQEILTILNFLKIPPPTTENSIPPLNFGPRPLGEMNPPNRNLFQYIEK